MKNFKRLFSMLMILCLTFSMAVVAFAAEDTYTITVANDVTGHTYEAYQIFSGSLSSDGKLTDIIWGEGVSEAGKTAIGNAAEKADTIENEAAAKAFANEISAYLTTPTATASTVTNGVYTLSGLTAGYYLIKDQDNSLTGNDSYTSYIMKLSADVEVTPKSKISQSHKSVRDVNDSDGTVSDWQDSADYDIGDEVSFQLYGTVAANYDNYTSYYYVFHDKESEGLTFDSKSVKVYVDGVQITSGYQVVSPAADGDTFDVVFSNLKNIPQVTADSIITVEYVSVLNDKAIAGSLGNSNEMYLEYSNNPNSTDGGNTAETLKDVVIVFSYNVVVDKVDGEGNPLTGAEFKLEKKNSDNTWTEVAVVKNDAGTQFTFKGLDDGNYRITETETPDGYNSIQPIYFTVTADHDVESEDPALTSLEATQTDANGNEITEAVIATFTTELTSGNLSTEIVNNSGATLPSTGGMGTTIFYILGGVLILAAAVILVVRKRTSTEG